MRTQHVHLFGLIGRKLGHSFSQRYFTAKFAGLPCRYELFELPEISALPDLWKRRPNLRGLNVTIPYKTAVLPYLDDLSPEARAVGAVNTIVFTPEGQRIGHNTDVAGFRAALNAFIDEIPPALILGNGGAARAVDFVLMEIKRRIVIRRPAEGAHLRWEDLTPALMRDYPLLINTTPLGMAPDVDGLPPLPYNALTPDHLLFDLIYNPAETRFLAEGRRRGCRTCNGLTMLHAQAEAAWRLWQTEESLD